MDLENDLELFGLTKGEARAYAALLELGPSTAGPVIKKSRVSPSKIYDVLSRLEEKGLAGIELEGKVKLFKALPPARLGEFLENKKRQIEQQEKLLATAIPRLESLGKTGRDEGAEILQGVRGIKHFFDLSLERSKRGDSILVAGYPREASVLFGGYFKKFHKMRAKKGVIGKVIYNFGAWFGKKREARQLLQQRYLPSEVATPAFIYLFGDTVGTIIISEHQKLCFMIKNREVAESYRQYFGLLWHAAKKT